jgi:nitroimidazol reductase NimA-like FMN-containing flavoprotein (pyridoxamine 5'-phosphate oxidase superfamily)
MPRPDIVERHEELAAGARSGAVVLGRQDCLRLLAQTNVGRVAASVGALPTVLPVRFALVGEDVFFPAVRGGELDDAVRDTVVAVEADHAGPEGGWSVVVTGIAAEANGAPEVHPALVNLLAGDETAELLCWFRVPAEIVLGRRIPRPPLHVAGSVPAALVAGVSGFGSAPTGVTAPLDGSRLEPLAVEECLTLLATEDVGRLVVVLAGRPLVFPLNYALDGDAVVFRTAPGTKLHAIDRSLVAFEVDRWTTSPQSGWTVTVQGWAQEITSADAPGLRERLAALPVHPLAGVGDKHHYVRIVPCSITGSRLCPG